MSDADLVEAIRQVLADSPFHGEGYRKVWARLRHAGVRTSGERVRRLMRENGLQAATRAGRPRGPRSHERTIIPEAIDAMWGTDMTAALTVEDGQVAVFVAVDHCSATCVGIHAAHHGTRHPRCTQRWKRAIRPPASTPWPANCSLNWSGAGTR